MHQTADGVPRVSVIIPAYNCQEKISNCIASALSQTLPQNQFEIIVINDGSTDHTLSICNSIGDEHNNVFVINQENKGVSNARNAGMTHANGKYIAFLDGDDTLAPTTLKAAVDFFDAHYDQIDAVVYPMIITDGKTSRPHVREQILRATGVYDLSKFQNAFALVTNVNVLIKNDESLPRFREDLFVHEDEQFFLSILLKKQKVGFSKEGFYQYNQSPDSAISTKMHPFYQFERNIAFWEDLFGQYKDEAPIYLQASFLNEVSWKLKKNLFFPHHYGKRGLDLALDRISRIMDRVDADLIFASPRSDEYLREFLLSLKASSRCICRTASNTFALEADSTTLLCRKFIEATITHMSIQNNQLALRGELRSCCFPHLEATASIVTGESSYAIELREPASDEAPTQSARSSRYFKVEVPLESNDSTICMQVKAGEALVPARFSFVPRLCLQPSEGIEMCVKEGFRIAISDDRSTISYQPAATSNTMNAALANLRRSIGAGKTSLMLRTMLLAMPRGKNPIWIYCDSGAAPTSNVLAQYLHDSKKKDHIKRFLVVPDELINEEHLVGTNAVAFSSLKHRMIHLKASKIITSCEQFESWCPFSRKTIARLSDLLKYELFLMPHGVRNSFSVDSVKNPDITIDKIFTATKSEYRLYQKVGYFEDQLLPTGLPHFDLLKTANDKKTRLLFAPSWRSYLVDSHPRGKAKAKRNSFINSSYWKGTRDFLSSDELTSLLERHDCFIDIKLHPNSTVYRDCFSELENDRIHLVDRLDESIYSAVITDFSSIAFDFALMELPVLFFIPDESEFKSGLHYRRLLEVPLENEFETASKNAETLISNIRKLLDGDITALPNQRNQSENFFFLDDRNRERCYQALMSSPV